MLHLQQMNSGEVGVQKVANINEVFWCGVMMTKWDKPNSTWIVLIFVKNNDDDDNTIIVTKSI